MESSAETLTVNPNLEIPKELKDDNTKLNFINSSDERLVDAQILGYKDLVKVKDLKFLIDNENSRKNFIYILLEEQVKFSEWIDGKIVNEIKGNLEVVALPFNQIFKNIFTNKILEKVDEDLYTVPVSKTKYGQPYLEDLNLAYCLLKFNFDFFKKQYVHLVGNIPMAKSKQIKLLEEQYKNYEYLYLDTKRTKIENATDILHIPLKENITRLNIEKYVNPELKKFFEEC